MNDIKNNSNYTLLTIPLPQPPGLTNLPSQLFFYVDDRFSATQRLRIRNVIFGLFLVWEQHYVEKYASGISQLATCTNKYAKRGLVPIWFYSIPFTNGADAVNYAMDILTYRFRLNGSRKINTIIKYQTSYKEKHSTIFAYTSDKIKCASLSIKVNPIVISDTGIGNLSLIGSLFHAWLHRCGYDHPNRIYTSFLIGEAPMCVMRGYKDKVPDQSDTDFTQFFD